ncbi:DUF5133 domain-containing protein [Streptomyces bobili]|uniref:DUF5133 domain-containing protein n=1 Tax=Streptomyces bobili TaxID=67280 RepID=UPI003F4DEEFB
MIVPDPKTVRTLLTRYASLRIAQAERETPRTARELEDVVYTLCVLMATSDVRAAVAAADALLAAEVRPPTARVPKQDKDAARDGERDPDPDGAPDGDLDGELDGESGLSLVV